MKESVTIAFREWAPGVIAGLLPFSAFLLAVWYGYSDDPKRQWEVDHVYHAGMISHFLVLALVTSSVTLISSFVRIWDGRIKNFASRGYGPVFLIIFSIAILMYSTVLYVLHESGSGHRPLFWPSALASMCALLVSLNMEISIARLHLLSAKQKARKPRRNDSTVPTTL